MLVNLAKQGLGAGFSRNARRVLTRQLSRSYSSEQYTYGQEQSTAEEEQNEAVKFKPQYKLHFKPDKTVLLYQGPLPILNWKNWAMFALFSFFLYKAYMKIKERAWVRTLLYSGGLSLVGVLGVYQLRLRSSYISSIRLYKDGQKALFKNGLFGRKENLVPLKSIFNEQTNLRCF